MGQDGAGLASADQRVWAVCNLHGGVCMEV